MIAGTMPKHQGNHYSSIVWRAQDVLQTEKVHTYIKEHNNILYFFAAPSSQFIDATNQSICLAKCLPGNPMYSGDGIYIIKDSKYTVALLIKNEQIELVFNENSVMNDWLEEEKEKSIAVFYLDCDSMDYTYVMTTAFNEVRHTLDKNLNRLGVITMVATLLFAAGTFTLHSLKPDTDFYTEFNKKTHAYKEAAINALKSSNAPTDLAMQARRLQEVSATVVKAGGWINSYEINDKMQESIEARMPVWVTPEYLVPFAGNIQTLVDKKENMLAIYKNQLKEEKK